MDADADAGPASATVKAAAPAIRKSAEVRRGLRYGLSTVASAQQSVSPPRPVVLDILRPSLRVEGALMPDALPSATGPTSL